MLVRPVIYVTMYAVLPEEHVRQLLTRNFMLEQKNKENKEKQGKQGKQGIFMRLLVL